MIVCEECGSNDVEGKYWVNLNTFRIIDVADDCKNFCNDCDTFVSIKEVNENECPNCGSDCIIDYEDLSIPDENIEHEILYDFQCVSCGHLF